MKKRFQKPKDLVSFMLVLAIMTTSFAIPNNVETVKAETVSVNPTDYDEYVDYLEALVTSMAGKKVATADYTNIVSGTDENGNLVYYTYLFFIEQMGYVLPSDCTQILVDLGNLPFVGYKSDGTKVVIVKTDGFNSFGYDADGYDRQGYNMNGYDRNGCDRDGKPISDKFNIKFNATQNKYGNKVTKISISVEYSYDIVSDEHYNVSVKKNTNEKGFGEYEYTITFDDKYYNAVVNKSFTVVPKIVSKYDHSILYFNGKKVTRHSSMLQSFENGLAIYHTKNFSNKYDGVEIITSSKKNGKGKVYEKKNFSLKQGTVSSIFGESAGGMYKIKKAKYYTCRFYIKVNGKKYYSKSRSLETN